MVPWSDHYIQQSSGAEVHLSLEQKYAGAMKGEQKIIEDWLRLSPFLSQVPLIGKYLWPGTIELLVLVIAVVIIRRVFAERNPAPS
jgi:hypothetical protein